MARSRIPWGLKARGFWKGDGRIKGETESESGIMKQFITDLITVKPHSNHPGASEGNPFNITGEKGSDKDARAKQRGGWLCEGADQVCLSAYLLTLPPGLFSLTHKIKVH